MKTDSPRLSEVLITMGLPELVINQAADRYYAAHEHRFGEWLVVEGIISRQQLSIALARQALAGGKISDVMVCLEELEALRDHHRVKAAQAVSQMRVASADLLALRKV